MTAFAIFKRFNDIEQANELADEFKSNGIECKLIDDSPSVDLTFTGNSALQREIQLMIKQSDFERANKILDSKVDSALLSDIDKDYYIFDFTNDELYEILAKPDEWNNIDYKLAQLVLKERGQNINEDFLQSLKQKRIEELSEPDKGQKNWIIIGYFFSILGGPIGIIIGWFLWTMKKTLPNGEKIFVYSEGDRKHGRIIYFIGVVVFTISLLILILEKLDI